MLGHIFFSKQLNLEPRQAASRTAVPDEVARFERTFRARTQPAAGRTEQPRPIDAHLKGVAVAAE